MRPLSCISFESYIKPQLGLEKDRQRTVVYLLNPTSNHNQSALFAAQRSVVYLLTPTSNHNFVWYASFSVALYIFWLLHQTTTSTFGKYFLVSCISFDSYIKPQHISIPPEKLYVVYLLTPTSNHNGDEIKINMQQLYIFWLLHQTTTTCSSSIIRQSCISFDSYIKPQLDTCRSIAIRVVYLLNPTSNHNLQMMFLNSFQLYIFWLLHQTTTYSFSACEDDRCISLHQTTTLSIKYIFSCRCISFDSYIKPQPIGEYGTSSYVVYLLTPTSNHNQSLKLGVKQQLYIFWLLHQTTTLCVATIHCACCISFDSYIKPQHKLRMVAVFEVVYLLTPTSNLNYFPNFWE